MKKEILKKYKIPDSPGVYFFQKGREILYIGKATSLKDRVKSYFTKDLIGTRGPIIVDLIFKADKIKWQKTDSVLEALILEANLIKKHQPKYNTKEKSDKSFNYVCVTKEKLPRILIIREKNIGNFVNQKFYGAPAKPSRRRKLLIGPIFGPFPNSSQLKEALKIIRPIFPFLDEKSNNNYKFYKQIDLVPDVSTKEGIKNYRKDINKIKLFFEGRKNKILKDLEKEMKSLAKEQKFEKAGEVKKRIFALRHINDIALIKPEAFGWNSSLRHSHSVLEGQASSGRSEDSSENYSSRKNGSIYRIEAYDIAHMAGKNMVGVMVVMEDGGLERGEYRKFRIKTQSGSNDTGALLEVLERRFGHREWNTPDLIVVDGSTAQINTARGLLKKLKLNVKVASVVKDERHKAREIKGDKEIIKRYKQEILHINEEAHRFAIAYHKKTRAKNFLKK